MSRNGGDLRERFLDLEAGRLPPAEARELRREINASPELRRDWEGWEADDARLGEALRPEVAPRDIAGAALAVLRARTSVRARRPRPVLVWGAVAAAAAIAVAVGAGLLLRDDRYPRLGAASATVGWPRAIQRGTDEAATISAGMDVFDGDKWITGETDEATLRLDDGSTIALKPQTEVWLSSTTDVKGCKHFLPHMCVQHGELECHVRSSRHFQAVGTWLGSVITKQRARFRLRYEPGVKAILTVLEGDVVFSCPEHEVIAPEGSVWEVDPSDERPHRVDASASR